MNGKLAVDLQDILESVTNITPDRTVFGASGHPRIVADRSDQPEYAKPFAVNSHTAKLCFCQAGPMQMTLNGRSYELQTNDICFVDRYVDNYESFAKEKEPYTLVWFLISWWGQLLVHRSVYNEHGEFTVADQQRIKITGPVVRKLEKVFLLGQEDKRNSWETIQGLLTEVFLYISKQKICFPKELKSAFYKKLVNDVATWLDEHYKDKLTLPEVAAQFKYSPGHLDTLFKQEKGMGIIQHLILQRMLSAGTYLTKTTLRISEIAEKMTYDDIYYFSKLFKRVYGCSPRDFRNRFAR